LKRTLLGQLHLSVAGGVDDAWIVTFNTAIPRSEAPFRQRHDADATSPSKCQASRDLIAVADFGLGDRHVPGITELQSSGRRLYHDGYRCAVACSRPCFAVEQ